MRKNDVFFSSSTALWMKPSESESELQELWMWLEELIKYLMLVLPACSVPLSLHKVIPHSSLTHIHKTSHRLYIQCIWTTRYANIPSHIVWPATYRQLTLSALNSRCCCAFSPAPLPSHCCHGNPCLCVYAVFMCWVQVGCHTFNLPANTHQQENLFQGQRIRAETPVDVTGCVSCQISSVLLDVIGSRRIAKEPLPSLFVWSRLGVLLTFIELDSGNKPWHKTLSSPTASSQRCCTHGTHISRTHPHTHR